MRKKLELQADRIVDEVFVPMPGYEEIYEISDFGQVRRVSNSQRARAGFVKSLQVLSSGYVYVHLSRDGHDRSFRVHRLVYQAFVDEIPPGFEINHVNGDKADNWVGSLECVTHSENLLHAYASLNISTKKQWGEDNDNALLSSRDVVEIRELYQSGRCTQNELARQFGTCRSNISLIVNYKRWPQ